MLYNKIIKIDLRPISSNTADKSLLERLANISSKNNLTFSYTFDLRNNKLNKKAIDFFLQKNSFQSEICNYHEYYDLAKLFPKKTISLHLTRFRDDSGNYKGFALTDLDTYKRLSDKKDEIYTFIKQHKNHLPNISFHLGLACPLNKTRWHHLDGHIVPNEETQVYPQTLAINNFIRSLNKFTTQTKKIGFKGDLLVEVLDYRKREEGNKFSAYDYFCEPKVVNEILDKTNTKLLIDISHIIITVQNLYNKKDFHSICNYINSLCNNDYSKIKEIHFLVPQRKNGNIYDCGDVTYKGTEYPNLYGQKISGALFTLYNSYEFKTSVKVLKYIIKKRKKYKDSLIVNFESTTDFMKKDIKSFIREFEGN